MPSNDNSHVNFGGAHLNAMGARGHHLVTCQFMYLTDLTANWS